MATEPVPFATVEEYLEYDRKSEFKNEYVFGEIVGMAGRDTTPQPHHDEHRRHIA